jgi:hypothetical protein
MASAAVFQSVAGGLVDCRRWTSPLEGAFTMTAKIALVNALSPRALCELLFGKNLLTASFAQVHGRSFLDSVWVAPTARATTAANVMRGFLSSQCGSWASVVASDTRLRLCPSCAELGYQSALFQIDALATCPIHGDSLVVACPLCGAPTPRYALNAEAFQMPMQCTACGAGYGRAWNGTADFSRWSSPPDVTAMRRLARQLRAWHSSSLEWPEASNWLADPDAATSPAQRSHVFHALTTLSGAPRRDGGAVAAWSDRCAPSDACWRGERPRVAIYKAIWRHIIKCHGLNRMRDGFEFNELFYLHSANGAIVPRRSNCPPCLHAFVLWTKRCELGEPHGLRRWQGGSTSRGYRYALGLHPKLLRWPSDVSVSDRLWGHFVWRCFVEDLWTAQRWQAATASLGDPLERGNASDAGTQAKRARFMEYLTIWMSRMSPQLEFFPSGLSYFSSLQGSRHRQVTLLAIRRPEGGFHDAA